MSTAQLVADLSANRARALAAFAAVAGKEQRSYAPGKWTAAQVLHHIADAETVLFDRIRRALAEDKPIQFGFDQDAWVARLGGGTRSLAVAQALFAATRDAVLELARTHAETDAARPYVHSQAGLRTVGQEFAKVLSHCAHHLDQVERAISG